VWLPVYAFRDGKIRAQEDVYERQQAKGPGHKTTRLKRLPVLQQSCNVWRAGRIRKDP
jgi:hypothetical protein